MCIVLLLYLVSQIDQPDDTGIQVSARTRVYNIVRVFCLQSFTGRVKYLSFSVLWVKAKGKFAFTARK